MELKRSVNFRHRRAVDVSPMVEVGRVWIGLLTSAFGEARVVSPKMEIRWD